MKCKVTKFWEVNYKILMRILATPVVITTSNPNLGTPVCFICSGVANLHHVLLECSGTVSLHNFIMKTLEVDWPNKYWIFGSMSIYYNPVIWVSNFSIYKAHLLSVNGDRLSLKQLFLNECECYVTVFPVVCPFTASFSSRN